jgi:hypothetical protein
MVIRTEYRSQRYSMGSSDPLPAGFKIRFGSLIFHATGNDYLMRITNRDELHPWRSTRPGPVPATPTTDVPAPTLVDAAGPSAPRRPRRSGQCSRHARMGRHRPRALRHNAMHLPAGRQRRPRGSARFPGRDSPTGCATPRQPTLRPLALTWRRTRTFSATTCWRFETSSPPLLTVNSYIKVRL